MYFQYLPRMMYDPAGDGRVKVVTNILRRVRVRVNTKKEIIKISICARS